MLCSSDRILPSEARIAEVQQEQVLADNNSALAASSAVPHFSLASPSDATSRETCSIEERTDRPRTLADVDVVLVGKTEICDHQWPRSEACIDVVFAQLASTPLGEHQLPTLLTGSSGADDGAAITARLSKDDRLACSAKSSDASIVTSNASMSTTKSVQISSGDAETPMIKMKSLPAGDRQATAAALARIALHKAAEHMEQYDVLSAERVLMKLIEQLQAIGSSGRLSLSKLYRSDVYKEVANRCRQYQEAGAQLLGDDCNDEDQQSEFIIVHKCPTAVVSYRSLDGGSGIAIKVAFEVDSSLSNIALFASEPDLTTNVNKSLTQTPNILGTKKRFQFVTHAISRMFMLQIEAIVETTYFCNTDFGFVLQRNSSEFTLEEGVILPPKSWCSTRSSINMSSIILPKGGGQDGSIWIQMVQVDFGVSLPSKIIRTLVQKVADVIVKDAAKSFAKVASPESPWQPRLQADAYGTYAAMRGAEVAAAERGAVSIDDLPGAEIFSVDGYPRLLTTPELDALDIAAVGSQQSAGSSASWGAAKPRNSGNGRMSVLRRRMSTLSGGASTRGSVSLSDSLRGAFVIRNCRGNDEANSPRRKRRGSVLSAVTLIR